MKIIVISDTHIPERAKEIPQALLNEFKKADMLIHAGDITDLSVLETLKTFCREIKAVSGNMDPEETQKKLPRKEILKIGKYRIGIMHGWGAPVNLIELLTSNFENDNVNLIIFGHSHASFNEKRNGILFFNPGSLTDKICSNSNSYGIIEINDSIETKIIKINA